MLPSVGHQSIGDRLLPPSRWPPAVNSSLISESASLAKLNESRTATILRWHERFAHISPTRVARELSSQEIKPDPGAMPDIRGPCAFKASSKPILSTASSKRCKRKGKSVYTNKKSNSSTYGGEQTKPPTPIVIDSIVVDEPIVHGTVKAIEVVDFDNDTSSPTKVNVRKPGQITLVDIKVQDTPGGKANWLVFVDAATNHTHVELLTTKSAANLCAAIDKYLVRYGQFIQRGDFFHSDSESNFLSAKVAGHLARNGQRPLILEASPPYTQQLNGKVERIAGLVNKKADCMFQHFKSFTKAMKELDFTRLGMYSFQHAAEIFNRLTPARGGKSPNELMFGRVPPHTELRVFGSLSYINYTKAEAAIHGVKMEPAIYIGFNSVNSAHAFYCPRTKVRRHSVMVDIDEAFSSLQFFAFQSLGRQACVSSL